MWVMKPPSRALWKLFRFKILSLGELLWVWQEAYPEIPGDFQVSWRVFPSCCAGWEPSLLASHPNSEVEVKLMHSHSFIHSIHSNWFTECQFYNRHDSRGVECSGGQNPVPAFLELNPVAPKHSLAASDSPRKLKKRITFPGFTISEPDSPPEVVSGSLDFKNHFPKA